MRAEFSFQGRALRAGVFALAVVFGGSVRIFVCGRA